MSPVGAACPLWPVTVPVTVIAAVGEVDDAEAVAVVVVDKPLVETICIVPLPEVAL